MKLIAKRVQHFLVSEDGPTAVEYAVMLAMIIMICIAAIESMGTNTSQVFANTAASMSGS